MLRNWHKHSAGLSGERGRFLKWAGVAVLALGMGAMAQAAPIVISGPTDVDDLNMRPGWKIWGSHTANYVGFNGSYIYHTALRFNVAGNSSLAGVTANQIQSATIVLNATLNSGSTTEATYDLYRLKREFVEGDFVQSNPNLSSSSTGANSWTYFRASGTDVNGDKTFTNAADRWSTAGGYGTDDRYSTVDASFTGPTVVDQAQVIHVNVTQYVKDVLNGTASDLGWIMEAHDETQVNSLIFNSSEVNQLGVRMEITTVPEPVAMSLLMLGGLLMVRRRRS